MGRREFLKIFNAAERKFGKDPTRLAGEGWPEPWQLVITTIMSAQSRDETTIPVAEGLFRKFPTLEQLAQADSEEILAALKSLNYNKTKARHILATAKILNERKGEIPNTIDGMLQLPGVGRKTANLVVCEIHNADGICVDTHVHRISNVLGLVKTKTPHQTEKALQKIAPKRYWSRINRLFVLWGKKVPGRERKKLMAALK
ncbi:endonuclease III [Candidatus Woesearchaeota archaeon]|nr:endonuclease III [Candidatus Woesearchaeota archaeon]